MRVPIGPMLQSSTRHEVTGRAAQIAFYSLLALFPALLAVIALLSSLDVGLATLSEESLSRLGLPRRAIHGVLEEVDSLNLPSGLPLAVAIAMTFYYGTRALGAAVRGVELAFSRRLSRVTTLRSGLLGLGITGLLLVALPVVLMVLTVGSGLLLWAERTGLLPAAVLGPLALLRWPVLCVGFQQASLSLYRLGAQGGLGRRLWSWGSVGASLAWALITLGFEWYLEAFADLGATYGSLGASIGLLLYVHIVVSTILMGAELDAQVLLATGKT